jgi:hypothetical protein
MRTNLKKGKAMRFHPKVKAAQIKSVNVVQPSTLHMMATVLSYGGHCPFI